MSVVAPRCTSQPLSSSQQGLHSSHVPHSLYIPECRHRTTQQFLRPSVDSNKSTSTPGAVPGMTLSHGTHPYAYQQPFQLSNLSGVHHLSSTYSSVQSNTNATILPPPRSYYVVSWVPRALPEVVQLIKDIPSEEERSLINRHFELGMLVMRRCGVQNPEEIKCLLDGFREGTTRLSLKDSSSKATTSEEMRNNAASQHSPDINTGYATTNMCCTPTVERRRLLIFFNDHRASRPWVLCPAKHCIKSARTTGKVKGRVKILQFDQQSTSVKIPKLFMDCLSDFLTRDHYVFATFCPQQKYTDHELDWFGVSDRSNEMNDGYGGDTIFRELVEEHDTKGSHRMWPFEDYIIFSNSQAKILAVFKKKQPLLTLYRNQLASMDDCLSCSTTASSTVLGSFMSSTSQEGSLPWHPSMIGSSSPNRLSSSLGGAPLSSDSCLQKPVKNPSYQYTGVESDYNSSLVSNGADDVTVKGLPDFEKKEINDCDSHHLKISLETNLKQTSSNSPSANSSTPSLRRKQDERRRRRKRRRYIKPSSSTDLTPSEECDYTYNMREHETSTPHSCETPLIFNSFMPPSINSSSSFPYNISRLPNAEHRNKNLELCGKSINNNQLYTTTTDGNIFCQSILGYGSEKKTSASVHSSGSDPAGAVMYNQNEVGHLETMSVQRHSHMLNLVQPVFNGTQQKTSEFDGTSEMGGGHSASYHANGNSIPCTISGGPTSEAVRQAKEAELVLIKIMTGVLAHLEPLEDPGNLDLNVVYQNVTSNSGGLDLHSTINGNPLMQRCPSIPKTNINNTSNHTSDMKEGNYSTCFLNERSESVIKYNTQSDSLKNLISSCQNQCSLESTTRCSDSRATCIKVNKDYDNPSYHTGSENDSYQESCLVIDKKNNINNDTTREKMKSSDADSGDCMRPNTDPSPITPITTSTTTNSSITSGTDVNGDDLCSGTWITSSIPDDNNAKDHERKYSGALYNQGQDQARVRGDVSYNAGSDKEGKQKRKVMNIPPSSSAVLYHDLVRQFLSRVAFGLEHPPLPQKRIPDTVKRVVTKIVTDTIRDINLALLSSSIRWCSDLPSFQVPNYALCKNSAALQTTGDMSTCFSSHHNAATAAVSISPHSLEDNMDSNHQVVSPWIMACWQGNTDDMNMRMSVQQGSCSEQNLNCDQLSVCRTTGFNPLHNSGQICSSNSLMEEAAQDPFRLTLHNEGSVSTFPTYLNGDVLVPQFPPSYYIPQPGDSLMDLSATSSVGCLPLTVLPSTMSLELKNPPHSNFSGSGMPVSTPDNMPCFNQLHNACTVLPHNATHQLAYNGTSTSTTSSNGNLGIDDLLDVNPDVTDSMIQNQFLETSVKSSKKFPLHKKEDNFLDNHILFSTSSLTSPSFPLEQQAPLSNSLLYDEYTNHSRRTSFKQEGSKYIISPSDKLTDESGQAPGCDPCNASYENGSIGQNDDISCPNGCLATSRYSIKKSEHEILNECSSSNSLTLESAKEGRRRLIRFRKGKSCTKTRLVERESGNYKFKERDTDTFLADSRQTVSSTLNDHGGNISLESISISNTSGGCDVKFTNDSQFSARKNTIFYSNESDNFDKNTTSLIDGNINNTEISECQIHPSPNAVTQATRLENERICEKVKCFPLSSYNPYKDCKNSSILSCENTEINGNLKGCLSNDVITMQSNGGSLECHPQHGVHNDHKKNSLRLAVQHADHTASKEPFFSSTVYSNGYQGAYMDCKLAKEILTDPVSDSHIHPCSPMCLPLYMPSSSSSSLLFNLEVCGSGDSHDASYSGPHEVSRESKCRTDEELALGSTQCSLLNSYFESEKSMFNVVNSNSLGIENQNRDEFSIESECSSVSSMESSNKLSRDLRNNQQPENLNLMVSR